MFISGGLSTHSSAMDPTQRRILVCAGVLGFLAVTLGAFGAHALKPMLMARGMVESWETAVLYHLVHSVALLALGFAREPLPAAAGRIAGCWAAGIALFCGSIYLLALGGPKWLGPVTPVGGLALLAGWALVAWSAGRRSVA